MHFNKRPLMALLKLKNHNIKTQESHFNILYCAQPKGPNGMLAVGQKGSMFELGVVWKWFSTGSNLGLAKSSLWPFLAVILIMVVVWLLPKSPDLGKLYCSFIIGLKLNLLILFLVPKIKFLLKFSSKLGLLEAKYIQ